MRTVFAIVFASLIVAAIPGPAQSAPFPPIPAGTTVHLTDLTEVAWRRCWRDRWGRRDIVVAVGTTVGAACTAADGDFNCLRLCEQVADAMITHERHRLLAEFK